MTGNIRHYTHTHSYSLRKITSTNITAYVHYWCAFYLYHLQNESELFKIFFLQSQGFISDHYFCMSAKPKSRNTDYGTCLLFFVEANLANFHSICLPKVCPHCVYNIQIIHLVALNTVCLHQLGCIF